MTMKAQKAQTRGGANTHERKSAQAYRGGKDNTREERRGHDYGKRISTTVKRASRVAITVVGRRKVGITEKTTMSVASLALVLPTVCRTVEVKLSSSNRERHQQISPC